MEHLLPYDMEPITLDSGLRLHPQKLQGELQAMIDNITADTETIILGFGLYSMGMLGRKERGQTALH
jgi:hypothetical protein